MVFFPLIFWCRSFLKSLLNLLQYCFCFMFWGCWPWGMWVLSSLTRDQILTLCSGKQSLNHWTTREVPTHSFSDGDRVSPKAELGGSNTWDLPDVEGKEAAQGSILMLNWIGVYFGELRTPSTSRTQLCFFFLKQQVSFSAFSTLALSR